MPLNVNGVEINSTTTKVMNYAGVIKRGLVLHLDAGALDSYPTTGTAWSSLTGSLVGTLTNGPTYSTAGSGSIVFDGSNDFVELNTTSLISGTQAFTIEAFYTLTGNTGGELLGNYGTSYTSNTVWFSAQYGIYINSAVYVAGYPLTSGTYHMVATRDSSGLTKIYLNNSLSNSGTLNDSISTSQNFRIGADVNVATEPFSGNLYCIRVYNRDLAATEITQNYNVQKTRFGL